MRYVCLMFLSILVLGSGAIAQSKIVDALKDESFVTYRIVHPLHTIVATSKDVAYRLEFDPATKEIKSIAARVDVTSFDSGNSNRDSHAMEVIDAITYPDATFLGTTITPHGDSLTVGGKLIFHGVTNNIVATGLQKLSPEKDKLMFDGGFQISLTAFKIDRPSLLMIPVNDTLWFTLKAAFNLK
jgi:polyisoprenoid-binding protein YceI